MDRLLRVVVTDLDGTLLDHETYSFEAAMEGLEKLHAAGASLVLCSSKTRTELVELQAELGICDPFIAENGGGVFLPGKGKAKFPGLSDFFTDEVGGMDTKVLGLGIEELRVCFNRMKLSAGQGGIRGFGEMDANEVADRTGLSGPQAELALQRDFGEPFFWEEEPSDAVLRNCQKAAKDCGCRITRGGRFYHLTGGNDKGRAVRWLFGALELTQGVMISSLGLGDAANDLEMLVSCDEGILVERVGGGYNLEPADGIRLVEGIGPVGWNRAVLRWLHEV